VRRIAGFHKTLMQLGMDKLGSLNARTSKIRMRDEAAIGGSANKKRNCKANHTRAGQHEK